MRERRQSTEDYKAQIKHFIIARPGEALTGDDFQKLLDTTSAMAHVKRLMKQGHITRVQVRKGRGKRFSYKWHENALDFELAAKKNGLVVTKDLQLPEFALKGKLGELDKLAFEWQDTMSRPINGDHLVAVTEFRRWLKLKEKEVEQVRKVKIDEYNSNSRSVVVGVSVSE